MKQRAVPQTKDYSGYFLGAILIGIVLIVLGLTMAAAQPRRIMDRSQTAAGRATLASAKFTMIGERNIFQRLELSRGG